MGRRLKLIDPDQGDGWRTVVGVVDDVRYSGLNDPSESAIYTPFAQTPFLWTYVMVTQARPWRWRERSAPPSPRWTRPWRRPRSSSDDADVMAETVAQPRFNVVLLFRAGRPAPSCSAAVGIYGVISYSVVQRTKEIKDPHGAGCGPP